MATIFDGAKYASEKENEIGIKIQKLKERGIYPKLATILIGENKASKLYVGLKKKAAIRVGAEADIYFLPKKTKVEEMLALIDSLNEDTNVHGIVVQLPLPAILENNKTEILERIDPIKDIDGQRVDSRFIHPTVKAILEILKVAKEKTEKEVESVCVVGASGMVGKPLVDELKKLNYQVVECDKDTKNLEEKTKECNVVISATGVMNLIEAKMVKTGAIVIDVGSPWGDVSFDEVSKTASFITPVPGGVGPMTIACLLENLIQNLSFEVKLSFKYIE